MKGLITVIQLQNLLTIENYSVNFQSLPYALLQSVIMFVLELQYIDANLADEKDDTRQESKAQRLKLYEYRALNLFRDVDLDRCGDLVEVQGKAAGRKVHPQHLRINEDDEEGHQHDGGDDDGDGDSNSDGSDLGLSD